MNNLTTQKCIPCEGGALPMSNEEAEKYLAELKDWKHEGSRIRKLFTFKNFKEAIKFVNSVANIAELEGHHPDISISYNKVDISLWTHSIGGLSQNDFILAAKIDAI
ncbi:MAG: 4a-hydroxytetrahydrobiopterin dehydratase [bacterium]|nr:4a-hydroxytetrahydrobiopterin dehydratase [bacterium]